MKSYTFNNIEFIIGQNAQENWDILDQARKINPDYLWFHLNSFPSAYIIMYATLNQLLDNSCNEFLNYAANLCKINSKYKNLNDLKICYTCVKKLNKTQKIGEVTIKGKCKIIKI